MSVKNTFKLHYHFLTIFPSLLIIDYFTIDMDTFKECCNVIILRVVDDKNIELMGPNVNIFAKPKDLTLHSDAIVITSISLVGGTSGEFVEFTIQSDKLLLYLVLSCQVEGQFEDNAFILLPEVEKVRNVNM